MNPICANVTVDADCRAIDMTLDKGSLHPSVTGQAAYESAFLSAINTTTVSAA